MKENQPPSVAIDTEKKPYFDLEQASFVPCDVTSEIHHFSVHLVCTVCLVM